MACTVPAAPTNI